MPGRLARFTDSGKASAFAVHLAISSALVGLLAFGMLLWWYPPPFFMFDGGWQVLRLIVLVDVVLGPLFTLIVFDRAKPALKRDLAVIALVQAAALVYGAWIMHAYRPAFIVYAEHTFYSVNWRDIERATPDTRRILPLAASARGPVPVIAELPADRTERARLFARMTAGGPSVTHYGDLYRPLDATGFARIARESADIDALAKVDASIAAELARVRAAHAGRKLVFVPLDCRYGLIMLVFDRETMAIVDAMT